MNLGRYQVLYWPHWKPLFWWWRPASDVYAWVIYVWPIEVRCFGRSHDA